MDSRTLQIGAADKAMAEQQLNVIKTRMPNVYRAIQDKAAVIGNEAYGLVRRGLLGQPRCFYAFEAGNVVGTPFAGHPVTAQAALAMVRFGCTHVCIWGGAAAEGG